MTEKALQSLVLGRLTWEAAEQLLQSAGLTVAHRDPQAMAFSGQADLLWLTRDVATGNLVATGHQLPALPVPPPDEIAALLQGTDPRDALCGLQLAVGRPDPTLIAAALPLLAHPVPAVAQAALDWLGASLAERRFLTGIDFAGALFALPGWRREKLQAMRWWMRDPPAEPARVEGALARALTDPDWEIAVTAMLTAGALRLTGLRRAVARVQLPETKPDGVTHDEARMLLALRDAALQRLGGPVGKTLPPGVAAVLDGDPDGLPPGLRDVAAALSQPLPVGEPPKPIPAVRFGPAGPTLADGTLLTWVPPGTYRLGTPLAPRGAIPNPPHRQTLERGFYIDTLPRPAQPFAVAQAEARAMGARLPSPDEWEMAARGADGRRYCTGMNGQIRGDLSPLGLSGLSQGDGEWLDAGDGANLMAAGGKNAPIPATRLPGGQTDFRSYRLVFVV